MNADDTRFINTDSEFDETPESREGKKKDSADKANTIGTVAGAAGVGLAAGMGAAAAYANIVDDPEIHTTEHTETEEESVVQPHRQNTPPPVAEQPVQTVEEEEEVTEVTETEGPLHPEQEETVTVQETEEEDDVEIVNPDDEIINPDDVVEEILAVEEIDEADSAGDQLFTFDSLGTVYTIDGEELSAAAFHLEDGFEGVMVDVDGDGIFDEVAVNSDDGLVAVAEAPAFSVDDAEYQLSQDNNDYLAQEDNIDHTLEDDSFMDDIIDTETLA